MIEYIDHYTRDMIRANPTKWFVFGDNVARVGRGGQAREARGEPNTIGIATKWLPNNRPTSFFHDDDPRARAFVMRDLARIQLLTHNSVVLVPRAGVGTGLSRMPEFAPKLLAVINEVLFPGR